MPEKDELESRMLVAVRARSLTDREISTTQSRYPEKTIEQHRCVRCEHPNVVLTDPDTTAEVFLLSRGDRAYAFDYVFDAQDTNDTVYGVTVSPLIAYIMSGYNATCFAYGMTGAGKTYTMMGEVGAPGLCFLAVEELFRHIGAPHSHKYYSIHVSYLEIYNEKIKDLVGSTKKTLDIVEHAHRGIVVNNLTEYAVTNLQEMQQLMEAGNMRRTMASTGSNVVSSRSHAILQITVKERCTAPGADANVMQVCTGKLSLIDLAGSERASCSDMKGIRMVEGANINRSLLSLANCITVLANINQRTEKASQLPLPHIPYRDSKLTRLLKDSLGGNTRTVMIANISPSCISYEETVSTLKYASRARNIRRKIHKNISTEDTQANYKDIIQSLQGEIAELRTQVQLAQTANERLAGPSNAVESPAGLGIAGSPGTPKRKKTRKQTNANKQRNVQTSKRHQLLAPAQKESLHRIDRVFQYVTHLNAAEPSSDSCAASNQAESRVFQAYLLRLVMGAAADRRERSKLQI
eukprot:NODE_269_length_1877_cov_326.099015_g217_i0.p1 GENE.NODE_269_length_1877_cov_326.099015_g217_i0~~NODE_269_length_1877_cov_326.099015_g217_i0.p1  ORF type:complete len:523 (+),score=109.66 NODE_269_length_1877_cov_326.099015_g217_i0:189-1757(+)